MEQIQIIGNIGGDATIKDFNGTKYLSFTVGVNSGYKQDDGTRVEKTNWYNVLSRETGRAQWLLKGAKVFVQGRLKTGLYTNKDGEKRISLDINSNLIDIVVFAKSEDKGEGAPADDDGLPF